MAQITDRIKLTGFEELIRLAYEQQREILLEVIDMMNHDEFRNNTRDENIKHVIETSIDRYYPQ